MKTLLNIIAFLFLVGIIYYGVFSLGSNLKEAIKEKSEVDSLYKLKLQLEINNLTSH